MNNKTCPNKSGKTIALGRLFISDVLSTDQEETDKNVMPYCQYALKENSKGFIILRPI